MNEAALRWTSRKFWAAMVWEAVMVALRIFDKIPVDTFETLTWLLLGGYFLSNVAQKVLTRETI